MILKEAKEYKILRKVSLSLLGLPNTVVLS